MFLAQFEKRLVELGCPARRAAERVRELADHHEDLKLAGLAEGLSEKDAIAQADAHLGHPLLLAGQTVSLIRSASWWGRHPFIGFCLLPWLLIAPMLGICLGIFIGVCWLLGWAFGPTYAMDEPLVGALSTDASVASLVDIIIKMAAILLLTSFLLWFARRTAAGLRWKLVICVFSTLAAAFTFPMFQPHNVVLGIQQRPAHWFYMAVPLLCGLLLWLDQRRKLARFAGVPAMDDCAPSIPASPRPRWWRHIFFLPTYWIVAALAASIMIGILLHDQSKATRINHLASLRANVWPGERSATLAALKLRQEQPVRSDPTPVKLEPFINARLSDSWGLHPGNDLSGLPAGRYTIDGIPFDIAGKIQLMNFMAWKPADKFPWRVEGIPLHRHCTHLYVLHGADHLSSLGGKVAEVDLHYADGSRAELDFVAGAQVLDWWGPLYNTDSGIGRYVSSPGTVLAWAGSNAAIRKHARDFSLRLYLTTFANPHPEKEIATLDYVSRPAVQAPAQVAPFLLGLTTGD